MFIGGLVRGARPAPPILGGGLLACALLAASAGPARAALRPVLDPATGEGLLFDGAGSPVARRAGWVAETVHEVAPDRALVLWRSHPRPNYLRAELFRREAAAWRVDWRQPEPYWFRGEAEIRRGGRRLAVRYAEVRDNFEVPLLFRKASFRVGVDRLVPAGSRFDRAETDAQRRNKAAALAAEGDPRGAAEILADLPTRATPAGKALAAARATGAYRDDGLRGRLVELADTPDEVGARAAEALLRMKLQEVLGEP